MLFKRITGAVPWWPLSHLVGLGLYALAGVWAWFGHPQPLTVGILAVGIMLIVAVWEWGSLHGGWVERGVPLPGPLRRRADRLMAELEDAKKPVPPDEDRG